MKFSVAPESTRAIVLALFAIEWTVNCIVIDFQADIYTLLLLVCLISADLIKHLENPGKVLTRRRGEWFPLGSVTVLTGTYCVRASL